MMKTYIVLPDVQIHNANAMSSTYTIGFPAMTAWLGAVHALQRNLAVWDPFFSDIVFSKTAVVCHSCHLQVQKGYRNTIIGTANPLKKKGGAYERPPFVAEARVHVTVTLVIETSRVRPEYKERCEHAITMLLPTMKIASGDVLKAGKAEIVYIDEEKEYGYKPLIAKMMPGYVLIERRDILEQEAAGSEDGLDTLLKFLQIHCHADSDAESGRTDWTYERAIPGWVIPISVGFKAISPLMQVSHQRDMTKPHRFAENIVTLGEFKMPYQFDDIDDMMWHYEYDEEQGLYICRNQKLQ